MAKVTRTIKAFAVMAVVASIVQSATSPPPPPPLLSLSSRTWKYDVFLSFRGQDTRKTFLDHLYSALEQQTVRAYKDDETLPRGDTIGPSLLEAIQESQIALIVFSKNYAESSWCLDELAYIMKCKEERGQTVIPIFYDVTPSDVRKQNGQFGKAFSKHNKSAKFETWRKALSDASNMAGWEPKHIANGHEAVGIKVIVDAVVDKLLYLNSDVDENLVGMGPRFEYIESKLQIGSYGVRMIGIWGVGGGGKTTLAFFVYMKIRDRFHGHCFIENIRKNSEKYGIQQLQKKVLSDVLKKEVTVESVLEGRLKIQGMLSRRKVLLVLDDVDDLEQLEALAGSNDWFGGGSRIIVTTRNEHLLIAHRVDEVCPVSLLSVDESLRLFERYAYQENNPVEDYDKLSCQVACHFQGLPLALKIIGSSLYGKDKNEWISTLDKLREIPNPKVIDHLKVSYDGLEHDEKQIFLNIALFLRGCNKENAMSILEACGFHSHIGIKVLIQKALISISSEGFLDMHDLVQEMGHHIVKGEHHNNPEKGNRVWRSQVIEAIQYQNELLEFCKPPDASYSMRYMPNHISNIKLLRFLEVIIWHVHANCRGELNFISMLLPDSFHPGRLLILHIGATLQIEHWKGDTEQEPRLKEIHPSNSPLLEKFNKDFTGSLIKRPGCTGLPYLQLMVNK
uniref:TMV resistance protein N-like isoform X2 n=1 Tax=Erigeron canadensis TaxID=72917 RepID=UPI001CB911C9|nr:TMV resistance protein N-like isoform X2 [Erigeron canadensis]